MRDAAAQPFVGPRPFDSAEQALFFGRDREADDLLGLVMFHRVVLLYAQSGAGKSSLINTLVAPGLRSSGFRVLPVARVRGAGTIDDMRIENIYVFNAINAMLASGSVGGGDDLPALTLKDFIGLAPKAPGDQGPVLILDQFEELFTSHQNRWTEREAFFVQLADALKTFNSARVVLSMREDFIAEIDPLVWRLPDGIDARYRLELLRREAAVEAVTGPPRMAGVTIERHAAEKLVGQLLEVNAEGPGGRPQRVEGEFVEPVQLQIVCRRLWDRLPADVDVITEAHLERFGDVADALGAFYEDAVEQAARATGYPQKLIHLGCMQFVTSSGTRSMVYRDPHAPATGLLPNAVVDSLVDQHLLRAEIRAGAHWYEIIHDRLVEPIRQKKLNDEELKTLLRTTELLVAAVEQWESRRDFVSDRHILSAISEVKSDLRLSERELEFLGMNALGAGFEIEAWVVRLQAEAPAVLARILARASEHPRAEVRRNAAVALGHGDLGALQDILLRLATEDPDLDVRESAAASLACIDKPRLNERMFERLRSPSGRPRAVMALARMRNESALRTPAVDLARQWAAIALKERVRLAFAIARVRLEKGWPTLVYVGLFGAIGAAIFCGVPRMIPSWWGLTLTENPTSGLALSGLFQGAAGGVMWGGWVAASLALGWILFRRHGGGALNGRNAANMVLGTLGGVVGGIGVFAIIFFVFDIGSLYKTGWLPDGSEHRLGICLTKTHYCWFHPLLGIPFGAGAALAISALHTLPHWQRFIEPHVREGRIVNWPSTLWHLLRLSTVFSVPTAILLYAAALPLMLWLHHSDEVLSRVVVARTLFETASILTGNIGAVAGILFGQLVMRVGITIPARPD